MSGRLADSLRLADIGLDPSWSLRFERSRSITDVMSDYRLLTADEVADMLGVKTEWVYDRARRGELPHVQLGRYKRFRRESIIEWVEEQEH